LCLVRLVVFLVRAGVVEVVLRLPIQGRLWTVDFE
jgi:hypothetical protein